jgi:hypothetical protein
MNHPKNEEWVPYLFGDVGPKEERMLAEHLQQCDACREEVGAWQRSLHRLDAWRLPSRPGSKRQATLVPLLKWAAAAVLVLGIGFGIGRWSSPAVNVEQVRQAIEPQLREQLGQEFALMLRRQMDQAEEQRRADYVALKADLDTVAVLTETGLRRAERQLVQLAGYAQPANYTGSSKP